MQGFLFGKPVPRACIETIVGAEAPAKVAEPQPEVIVVDDIKPAAAA